MILAAHGIFGAYGFWLPNDPRGSWSDFVRSAELRRFGPATKIDIRQSVAHRPHDIVARRTAKSALRLKPVRFTGLQARAVARGFAQAVEESNYEILACAIMPDHAHVVVRKHAHSFERIFSHLKARATHRLVEESLHPFAHIADSRQRFPSVWAHRCWKVYLNSNDEILQRIRYVELNPVKAGLKPQCWSFVKKIQSSPV
jgi:REP element-mobilizing transposase RayT